MVLLLPPIETKITAAKYYTLTQRAGLAKLLSCPGAVGKRMDLLKLPVPVLLLTLFTACSGVVEIESSNQNSRVAYVVLHATSENFAESVRLLTTRTSNPVSSHYLIPAENDPTYPHRRLRLHRFVDENRRAWHAGRSYWAGETALNDRSIGIEIVNEFDCVAPPDITLDSEPELMDCVFLPFSEAQIEMTIDLLEGILQRFPDIDPINIVAHSDIAIMRRSDPGPLFPWKRLHDRGIGAWYDEETKSRYQAQFTTEPPATAQVQDALLALGYLVATTGELDNQTRFALRAMQLHFRPADYSGGPDPETIAIIWSLLEKYRPNAPQIALAGAM